MTNAEDIDRPPAGTECSPCRSFGHFCPATRYLGTTDRGICEPCARSQDCATNAAVLRALAAAAETVSITDEHQAAPIRSIPPEQWTEADRAIHETVHDLAEVPFGLRTAVLNDRHPKPANSDTIARKYLKDTFPHLDQFLSSLSEFAIKGLKYAASIAPPVCWFVEERGSANDAWSIVLDHPVFYHEREDARTLAKRLSKTDPSHETRSMLWKRGKAPEPIPTTEPEVSRMVPIPVESIPGRRRGKALMAKRQAPQSFISTERPVLPAPAKSVTSRQDDYAAVLADIDRRIAKFEAELEKLRQARFHVAALL